MGGEMAQELRGLAPNAWGPAFESQPPHKISSVTTSSCKTSALGNGTEA